MIETYFNSNLQSECEVNKKLKKIFTESEHKKTREQLSN